jgi:hypothetical protein
VGYDLIGAVLFAALTPLVVLGFIAFWVFTNRERARIEDAWETYAAKHTREYFPAHGEWPNRKSPGVRWIQNSITYELTVIGIEGGARTRIMARPSHRIDGNFTLRFDDERLDANAKRALVGFGQHLDVTLKCRRGRLILEWPGREANEARLDEATSVVTKCVLAMDQNAQRPPIE